MRRAFTAVLAIALMACARHPAKTTTWPWARSREDYIRRSAVWIGGDPATWVHHMRSLDLRNGPPGKDGFAPEALVQCTFVPPRDPDTFSGATPKFLCRRDAHDDVFKVKWGADNGEVYADVAGTRLFWALGFPADRVYPVRVECTGCADDPWRDPTPHPGHVPSLFTPAIVERQFEGVTIEEYPHQGWTWSELAIVDPSVGGAPRTHVDALRLLGAFVQHRDTKADNQRLVCPPDATVRAHGKLDCRRPVMFIDDLGSAFGGPTLLTFTVKMSLASWVKRPLWKDPARCIADVTSEPDATHGLDYPQIGEGGRRFLATLLSAFTDRQIRTIFAAARGDQRGAVSQWLTQFKRRRQEVLQPMPGNPDFRCPNSPS